MPARKSGEQTIVMFMVRKIPATCFAIILASTLVSAQRSRPAGIAAQTSFGMETPIKLTYRVPKYVIEQIVRNDDLVEPTERDNAAACLAERVQGSLLNLDNDGQPDFLVQGDDGANITGFWLFRNKGQRWQLVLATRALGLSLEKTYTNGFRDVSIAAASADTLWGATYKFDLERYVPRECWEKSISGRNPRKKYMKCSEDSEKPYR